MAKNTFIAEGLKHRTEVCGPILALNIIAMVFINTNALAWSYGAVWIFTAVLLTLSMMVIGAGVNGRFQGVLIDGRNRVSLSKFQMALWTVLVVSALITAAAFNEAHNVVTSAVAGSGAKPPWGPLDIAIPPELLEAMGIATTSLVATPALLSMKAGESAADGALGDTTRKLGLVAGQTGANGKVFTNAQPSSASWADMFRGDEVGNAASADLSKVQQFAITLLLFGVYASVLWSLFDGIEPKPHAKITALPPLSSGFVLLMAISHAGYLAYKATSHTPDAADPPPPPKPAAGPDGAVG